MSRDLENLENVGKFRCKEKMSGNLKKTNKKSQGKVREFSLVKFIFSQSEHHNFENFLGNHAPLTVLDTQTNLIVVREKLKFHHGQPEERATY